MLIQEVFVPTADELFDFAAACADKIDLPRQARRYPSFSEVEEQCETEFDALLNQLHEDEIFGPVDLGVQERLIEQITAELPAPARALVDELVDQHARHVWLHQEAAFQLGLAVGVRVASGRPAAAWARARQAAFGETPAPAGNQSTDRRHGPGGTEGGVH